MNTYYLKKFRKDARKHVRVIVDKRYYHDGELIIVANDYTWPIKNWLAGFIPNGVIWRMFPRGIRLYAKLYYSYYNGGVAMISNPIRPESLGNLDREIQIRILKKARYEYIKFLICDERNRREIYKRYQERMASERRMKKDLYELNRL